MSVGFNPMGCVFGCESSELRGDPSGAAFSGEAAEADADTDDDDGAPSPVSATPSCVVDSPFFFLLKRGIMKIEAPLKVFDPGVKIIGGLIFQFGECVMS